VQAKAVILSEAKNLNACQREMLRLRLSMTGVGAPLIGGRNTTGRLS